MLEGGKASMRRRIWSWWFSRTTTTTTTTTEILPNQNLLSEVLLQLPLSSSFDLAKAIAS
jgi:hypothetical protein